MLRPVAGDWDTPQQPLRPEQDSVNVDPALQVLGDFDYSTPEAQRALMWASQLLMEIREDYVKPASRKIALYERTLGLAVIPVLLRRGMIVLAREARRRRQM
jgi:hypothetical protein